MAKSSDENDHIYPLEERIGNPHLFVERRAYSTDFERWLSLIPDKMSKSRALLARKKSGKTAFVQRLFNQLWQQNGAVIPFFLEVAGKRIWYPQFAITYYRTFASQYISFLERDPAPIRDTMGLGEIRAYGESKGIAPLITDVDALQRDFAEGSHDLMWETAYIAPHRFASLYDQRILVIIDEFQNLSNYIYRDKPCKDAMDPSIPGSYHEYSESKVAPMLVTGSAVGWLVNVIDTYLEAGRLHKRWFSPYLAQDEGLEAVYRYAAVSKTEITNETALLINQLTASDPFFISCVFRSSCPHLDLASKEGVLACVRYEVGDRNAELASGWMVYLNSALPRINATWAKKILLFLTRNAKRAYTPIQIKEALRLELNKVAIQERLEMLYKADLILDTPHGLEWQGYQDGTLYLVLQERFRGEMEELGAPQEGIDHRLAELKRKSNSLQGALNNASGHLAELQMVCDIQMRKSFLPSVYFKGLADEPQLEATVVYPRHMVQLQSGSLREIDIRVDDGEERSLLIEIKKHKKKMGKASVEKFIIARDMFCKSHPDRTVLAGFLSLGGFTEEASALLAENNIGSAVALSHHQTEWSP